MIDDPHGGASFDRQYITAALPKLSLHDQIVGESNMVGEDTTSFRVLEHALQYIVLRLDTRYIICGHRLLTQS